MLQIFELELSVNHPSDFEVSRIVDRSSFFAYKQVWPVARIWLTIHESKALEASALID